MEKRNRRKQETAGDEVTGHLLNACNLVSLVMLKQGSLLNEK